MSLKISRILHAGWFFSDTKAQVIFDPIFESPFSKNCFSYPEVRFAKDEIAELKIDAIFISHYHDDHCSFQSLDLLSREVPIYIYCQHDELFDLLRQLGFKNVSALVLNQPVLIGEMQITARRALDAEVDCLFQIQTSEVNVLNVVDSWIDLETMDLLGRLGPWDLVVWPFQTMRELQVLDPRRAEPAHQEIPVEWKSQIQALNPSFVVPGACQFIQEPWSWLRSHFFPISYSNFERQVGELLPEAQLLRMDPGVSIQLRRGQIRPSEKLSWVHRLDQDDYDYRYDENVTPQTTAEIAKKLGEVSPQQLIRVHQFCEKQILKVYPLSSEGYFSEPRTWNLKIYDASGEAFDFFYDIDSNKMERRLEAVGSVSWKTEIPMVKLWSALEDGESLSSLYLRVNDCEYDEKIESLIRNTDVLEDPLIRTLFQGDLFAYQRSQLRQILNRGLQ